MIIAGVQFDVRLGEVESNLDRITSFASEARQAGAELVVFPECAVPGYCFESKREALEFAGTIPGPTTDRLARVCADQGMFLVAGLLEQDGEALYNACVLIGPSGELAVYRKIHLPFLGVDRFTTPGGHPFAVHAAGTLRVGMNICYDSAFPESARVMALAGADLIVLPTNFPPGGECMAQHVVHARAMENNVYYACVNRIGTERGFTFIGRSKICGPNGQTLAEAGDHEEAILYAEIDPEKARNKHLVRVPKLHEIDRFKDRRPEMYRSIAEENSE